MKSANGFTLAESLLVLLICTITAVLSPFPGQKAELSLFMRQMKTRLEALQMQAFSQKEILSAQVLENRMIVNGQTVLFPSGTACTPARIYFNEKGNVAGAGSLTCTFQNKSQKLVWQLGQGRMRIDHVR